MTLLSPIGFLTQGFSRLQRPRPACSISRLTPAGSLTLNRNAKSLRTNKRDSGYRTKTSPRPHHNSIRVTKTLRLHPRLPSSQVRTVGRSQRRRRNLLRKLSHRHSLYLAWPIRNRVRRRSLLPSLSHQRVVPSPIDPRLAPNPQSRQSPWCSLSPHSKCRRGPMPRMTPSTNPKSQRRSPRTSASFLTITTMTPFDTRRLQFKLTLSYPFI